MFRKLIPYLISIACLLMVLVSNAHAQLILANGYATGSWFNPARDGEGFYIEVVGEDDNLVISVAMYSYDEAGNQLWLVGSAPITATDVGASIPVILVEGPVWGTNYDSADQDTTQFGSIVVQFPTCDSALFNVNSNVTTLKSGTYSLVRLTEIVGMDCVEPPRPDEEPSTELDITPGLWTGEGVCFFVNEDGTKIVENDLCDGGKALSAEMPGIQVDLQGKVDPDPCQAIVACTGTWEIEEEFNEENQVTVTKMACLDQLGGIAHVSFFTGSEATVYVFESEGGEGNLCYGPDVVAIPAQ